MRLFFLYFEGRNVQGRPGLQAALPPAAREGGAEAGTHVSAAGVTRIRGHPSAKSPMSWIFLESLASVDGSPTPGPEGVGEDDGGSGVRVLLVHEGRASPSAARQPWAVTAGHR